MGSDTPDIDTPEEAVAAAGELGNLVVSTVRTATPLIAGQLIALGVDDATSQQLAAIVISLVIYIVVRLGELYVSPKIGWLLGSPKSPSY